jgi:hypothetical protein
MKNKFREKIPIRTCKKEYSDYHDYKSFLANDFFQRCGYTDCPDVWFGGKNSFHIDHFVPWKKHPENPHLKNDYQNLVYCCSYVNILKSDDEGPCLDPCKDDYNKHFYRDSIGNIYPFKSSKEANYMYKKLKLYLKRYQIIWMLDNILNKATRIKELMKKYPNEDNSELSIMQGCLFNQFTDYLEYLSVNL